MNNFFSGIGKLFGAKPIVESMEIPAGEAAEILAKRIEDSEKKFLEDCRTKITGIDSVLKKISNLIMEMGKRNLMEEGENKYFRKIVSTSQKNMVMQIGALAEKLSKKTGLDSAEGLREYSCESLDTIGKEIISFRKNISYTGTIMKTEVREIGELLEELVREYRGINSSFAESGLPHLREIEKSLRETKEAEKNLLNRALENEKIRAEIRGLEEAFEAKKIEMQNLRDSGEHRRFKELSLEKKSVEQEHSEAMRNYHSLLSGADKALRRLLKSAETGFYAMPKSDSHLLSLYLESPLEAVEKDSEGRGLERVISEAKKALETGKIGLDEKEAGKKMKALESLAEGSSLKAAIGEVKRIAEKEKELEKELSGMAVLKNIERTEGELKALEAKIWDVKKILAASDEGTAEAEKALAKAGETAGRLFENEFGKKIVFTMSNHESFAAFMVI